MYLYVHTTLLSDTSQPSTYHLDFENGHLMITAWQMGKLSCLKSWHFCTSHKIGNTSFWTGIFTSNLQIHPSFFPSEKNALNQVTSISLHASTRKMKVNSRQNYVTHLMMTMMNACLIWINRSLKFTICIRRKMVFLFTSTSKYWLVTYKTYDNWLGKLIYQYWNRYPIEERRKVNIYRNPHMISAKHFFYMTGNSLENYWSTVDYCMEDGIDDSIGLSLPSKVLLFFIRLRKNKTFRWCNKIIYFLNYSELLLVKQ